MDKTFNPKVTKEERVLVLLETPWSEKMEKKWITEALEVLLLDLQERIKMSEKTFPMMVNSHIWYGSCQCRFCVRCCVPSCQADEVCPGRSSEKPMEPLVRLAIDDEIKNYPKWGSPIKIEIVGE